MMRIDPKYILVVLLVLGVFSDTVAQQCGNCKTMPTLASYDLDVQVPRPKLQGAATVGWVEWVQLFTLNRFAHAALAETSRSCIRFTVPLDSRISDEAFETKDGVEVPPLRDESDIIKVGLTYTNLPPSGDLSRFGNYISTGYIRPAGDGYVMHMEIQTACTRKVVAAADVPFQSSSSSEYAISIGKQAAAQLSPLIDKIRQFELKERAANERTALESPNTETIRLQPKKSKLAAGEETEILVTLLDCDGFALANRKVDFTRASLRGYQISSGTTGGTITPSVVVTDGAGKAKATFRMGKNGDAYIMAHHLYDKPSGCQDVKSGSTSISLLATPLKVELYYAQNETRTDNRASLPGVKVKGGAATEQTIMFHSCVMYHYPTADAVKQGYLIDAAADKSQADGKSKYVLESGYYDFTKKVEDTYILGMAGNVAMVQAKEEGSYTTISGVADLSHPSEILFFTGNANEPASFVWNVQYPAGPNGELAGGSMSIVKGEDGVKWEAKKITDPKSPYRTEYILELRLDAGEQLLAGEKAMKELFGFNVDDIAKTLDPTSAHPKINGASGSQSLFVRILSPYPAN